MKQLAKQTFPEIPSAKGDKDSRVGHTSSHESFTGYLPTLCIGDEHEGFITGLEVAVGNSYAADNFASAYQQHKEHTRQTPVTVASDSAFDQPDVHALLEQDKAIGYIKARRFNTNSKVISPDEFKFNDEGNLICPHNKVMQIIGRDSDYHIYRGTDCLDCPLASRCTTAKDGIRRVKVNPFTRQRRQELKILNMTEEFKQALETAFAHRRSYRSRQDIPSLR